MLDIITSQNTNKLGPSNKLFFGKKKSFIIQRIQNFKNVYAFFIKIYANFDQFPIKNN